VYIEVSGGFERAEITVRMVFDSSAGYLFNTGESRCLRLEEKQKGRYGERAGRTEATMAESGAELSHWS